MRESTSFTSDFRFTMDMFDIEDMLRDLGINGQYSSLFIRQSEDFIEIWGSSYNVLPLDTYYQLIYAN